MSFNAKDPGVLNQQLKVQQVVIPASATNMYVVDTGDVCVIINEALASVISCQVHDNSAATLTSVVAADLIISDSTAFTAAGDMKAVRVNGVAALDANDHIIMQYVVAE